MNKEELQNLLDSSIKRRHNDVPTRKCDVCNLVRPQDLMINFIFSVGSPGHPDLPSFQCPHKEHWACSIEHLIDIVEHCGKVEIPAIVAFMHTTMHEQTTQKSHLYEEARAFLKPPFPGTQEATNGK